MFILYFYDTLVHAELNNLNFNDGSCSFKKVVLLSSEKMAVKKLTRTVCVR